MDKRSAIGLGMTMLMGACALMGADVAATGPADASTPEELMKLIGARIRAGDATGVEAYLDESNETNKLGAMNMASLVEAVAGKLALQEAVRKKFGDKALDEVNSLYVLPRHNDGLATFAEILEKATVKRGGDTAVVVIRSVPVELVSRDGKWRLVVTKPQGETVEEAKALARSNHLLAMTCKEAAGAVAGAGSMEEVQAALEKAREKYLAHAMDQEK